MSVLGIDIGTSYCVLATVQRGAVVVVRNELSERLTPALVGFTDKERLIGDAAETQIRSNYKNTARNIKQLLGCSSSNPEVLAREGPFSLSRIDFTDEAEAFQAGYRVCYKGEECVMSATRCLGALLTKLKDIAVKSIESVIQDVVISVPGWYSDAGRQAVLDAAAIAGLTCLRVMNEHAAVSLDYGIYRSNTFDPEKPLRVCFVGIGHAAANVCVVDYLKGALKVVAVENDRALGGREMDLQIVKYFAAQFEAKYKVNPLGNAKARLKLEDAATKAKKIVSANVEAPFNVECLVEDFDLHGLLTRQMFEELCNGLRQQLLDLLARTFANGGASLESVQHLEIVGGCTRIPWVQETITQFFGGKLPLSRTLNMDEAVARGCALQGAILNPRCRVRDFSITDRLLQPVGVSWLANNQEKHSVVFDVGSPLALKRNLTFTRDGNFEVRLSAGGAAPLTSFIELPKLDDLLAPYKIRINMNLSANGISSLESAEVLIEEEAEERVKEKRPVVEPSEEEAVPPKFEEVEVVKKKKKTKLLACTVRQLARPGYLTSESVKTLRAAETAMIADDQKQREFKETMNTLESYIYKFKAQLQGELREFVNPSDAAQIFAALEKAEEWVYDNPDGTAELYASQLEALRALCNPVECRAAERVMRTEAFEQMASTISSLRCSMASPDFAHVDPSNMRTLEAKLSEAEKWLHSASHSVSQTPLCQDVNLKAKSIIDEIERLQNFSRTILVPKPVVASEAPSPTRDDELPAKSDVNMEDPFANTPTDTPASPEAAPPAQ